MLIHLFRPRSQHQRGDTLVEVLISMTVISLVLGGAYTTTSRSLSATRAAQERGNALKLAESQVEQIKNIVATSPDDIFGAGVSTKFCVDGTGTVYDASIAPLNTHCIVDVQGNPTTIQPSFTLVTTRTGNDFLVDESWYDVGGTTTDNLKLAYRVYQ